MEKILTIVIPTYNMEQYLDKCLTSLIIDDNEELMNGLEVLVIIDGAKDRSSEIAHSYQNIYPNTFRVIDKENGNYGSCVNRGLCEAAGKYIKVLDADDYLEHGSINRLLKLLYKIDADLILSDYELVDEDDNVISRRKFDIVPNKNINALELLRELCEVEMHAVVYRTKMLRDMNYTQTEGISYTDTEWVLLPMQNVKSVYYIPILVYKYLVGRSGQTIDINVYIRNRAHVLRIMERILNEVHNKRLYNLPISVFYKFRLEGIFNRYYSLSLIENKFPSSELINIDNLLKNFYLDLYDSLSIVSYSGINYIKLWRDNGYNLPYRIRMLIKIIRLKRKYLPNFKFGRVQKIEYEK